MAVFLTVQCLTGRRGAVQEQQLLEWITGGASGGTDPAALHAALSSLLGIQLTGSHDLPHGRRVDRPHWALLDKDGAASEDELNELLRGESLCICPMASSRSAAQRQMLGRFLSAFCLHFMISVTVS